MLLKKRYNKEERVEAEEESFIAASAAAHSRTLNS
jgi:hypothetical protein